MCLYLFVVGRDAEDKAGYCESSQNSSHLCSEEGDRSSNERRRKTSREISSASKLSSLSEVAMGGRREGLYSPEGGKEGS